MKPTHLPATRHHRPHSTFSILHSTFYISAAQAARHLLPLAAFFILHSTFFISASATASATASAATPLTPQEIAATRATIRAHLSIPEKLPALDARTHRVFHPAPGVRAEAITYTTQFGMRVPAILYLPDPLPKNQNAECGLRNAECQTQAANLTQPKSDHSAIRIPQSAFQKIPAILIVNGHGGDKYSWYSYYCGITYARAGAAVLTYDPAGEGERSRNRRSGTREHDYLRGSAPGNAGVPPAGSSGTGVPPVSASPSSVPDIHAGSAPPLTDSDAARKLLGLMLTDVMQAVTYLATRPEIDPARIAACGYSMGSFVMAIGGAIEPRLHAVILTGGGNLDGEGGYWETCDKPMCQGHPYQSLRFLGDRPAIIYALHADRGPTLIWNGRDDICNIKKTQEPFFDDLIARVKKLTPAEKQKNILTYGFTPKPASHRPYFITKPPAIWLARQLRFPNLTPDQAAALPEVHITQWAAQTAYPMDRGYTSEEREGGTMAVGDNVPAIDREQLSVFPPAEWDPIKATYTFDTWIQKIAATTTRDKPKPAKPQ